VPPDDSKIPVVGQPARILIIHPIVIINCNCALPNLNMLVLSGMMNHVKCQHCGKLYAVEALTPTLSGVADVVLNVVLPAPTGTVQ
jgi:hypothetical protein